MANLRETPTDLPTFTPASLRQFFAYPLINAATTNFRCQPQEVEVRQMEIRNSLYGISSLVHGSFLQILGHLDINLEWNNLFYLFGH